MSPKCAVTGRLKGVRDGETKRHDSPWLPTASSFNPDDVFFPVFTSEVSSIRLCSRWRLRLFCSCAWTPPASSSATCPTALSARPSWRRGVASKLGCDWRRRTRDRWVCSVTPDDARRWSFLFFGKFVVFFSGCCEKCLCVSARSVYIWIVLLFFSNASSNPTDFCDPMCFSVAPSWGWHQ